MSNPTLHVFNQYCMHDDVWLRGNRDALKRLRDTIDSLLAQPDGSSEAVGFWTNDGEGYNVYIINSDDWEATALPYRADWCAPSESDTFPWDEIAKAKYLELREKAIKGLTWEADKQP